MTAKSNYSGDAGRIEAAISDRTIALVGLMGAGKSTVGKRLAEALGRDFFDSDNEIERAAGLSISDIFTLHGEAEFRRGERRVLERQSEQPLILGHGLRVGRRRRDAIVNYGIDHLAPAASADQDMKPPSGVPQLPPARAVAGDGPHGDTQAHQHPSAPLA